MKKKLIIGLGLLLFIFVIGAAATIYNLHIVMESHRMVSIQDVVADKANEMLLQIKGAQAELYRHKAGYSRDINVFVDYVLGLEENLVLAAGDYAPYLQNPSCNNCHPAREHIGSYNETVQQAQKKLQLFKQKMSLIMTSRELHQQMEGEAIGITVLIVNDLENMKHMAITMKKILQLRRDGEISRAAYVIALTSLFSIVFAFIIMNVLFRKISVPLRGLLTGIERISSGDFDHQIKVITKDEIGVVAQTFNQMAVDMKKNAREKDSLLTELQFFNLELERKVSEVTAELTMANESIRRNEILAVVGTLAAGVSHELSTPLGTILGFIQLFKTQLIADKSLMEDIILVEQELLRCKKIVSDLLDAVKSPKREAANTGMNEVLSEALDLLQYQPIMKTIAVHKDFDPALPLLKVARSQMKQVFINILMNAMQAMPGGGRLSIATLNVGNGFVEIHISDTGKGIAPAEQAKIFKPFYTTREGGSGLGLSISADIIGKHGGVIKVKSLPGEGTLFTISLPLNEQRGGLGA